MTHSRTSRLLALDLGTRLGYASPGGFGVIDLKTCTRDPAQKKLLGAFYNVVTSLITATMQNRDGEKLYLAIERPFTGNLLKNLLGVVSLIAEQYDMELIMVNPMSLKKWATGSGKASKEQMMQKAEEMGYEQFDNNASDAALLWEWAAETLHQRSGAELRANRRRRS